MSSVSHAFNHCGTFINIGTGDSITFVTINTGAGVTAFSVGTSTESGMARSVFYALIDIVTGNAISTETNCAVAIESTREVVTDGVGTTVVVTSFTFVDVRTSENFVNTMSFVSVVASAFV